MKLALRRRGIRAAIGLIGLVALAAMIVTAVALLCIGLAQLVSAWCGGRAWAGNLVVGIALLGLLAGGLIVGMRYIGEHSRKRTVQNYELRRKRQRTDFGHDVARSGAADDDGSARD